MVDRRNPMRPGDGTWHQAGTGGAPAPAERVARPQMPEWMRRPLRVVPVILGLNVAVFLVWQFARANDGLQDLLITHFLVSSVHLAHGLVWTLITAAFSHNELWHLGINMVVLWSFGSVLERLWRPRLFIVFYLVAAVVSSLSHCLVSTVFLGRGDIPALGASGALSGLLLAYALLFPRQRILVFGILPLPALVGALAFVGLDIWGLIAQGRGGGLPIGHGAHLGGAACGAVLYLTYLRPRLRRSARRVSVGARVEVVPPLTPEEAAEIERLRRKVDLEGAGSLTPKEQDFLRRVRERMVPLQ